MCSNWTQPPPEGSSGVRSSLQLEATAVRSAAGVDAFFTASPIIHQAEEDRYEIIGARTQAYFSDPASDGGKIKSPF